MADTATSTGIDTSATFSYDGQPALCLFTAQARVSLTSTQVYMEPTYDGHGSQAIQLDIDNGKTAGYVADAEKPAFEAYVAGQDSPGTAVRPDGVVLTAPDGSRHLLTVTADGDLGTDAA